MSAAIIHPWCWHPRCLSKILCARHLHWRLVPQLVPPNQHQPISVIGRHGWLCHIVCQKLCVFVIFIGDWFPSWFLQTSTISVVSRHGCGDKRRIVL
jgi:hypothetical protein